MNITDLRVFLPSLERHSYPRLTAWCPTTGFLPDSFLLAAFGFGCVSLSGAYSVDASAEISMGLCSQECVWVVFLT